MPADRESGAERRHARTLLEQDRAWCAYALADLEAPFGRRTALFVGRRGLVVIYRGLTPPWLFAHGDPDEVDDLLRRIPVGRYQYALLATHRARLGERLRSDHETHMWRMVLRPEDFPARPPAEAERLAPGDLPALLDLFADHRDRPDTFDAAQLESGFFFGIRRHGRLVSAAGTHVVGRGAGVGSVGNVFTHPGHRRRGYAARASAAVVEALLRAGVETIVLNVAMANEPALALYHGLGFMPFCGYYEGVGELQAE